MFLIFFLFYNTNQILLLQTIHIRIVKWDLRSLHSCILILTSVTSDYRGITFYHYSDNKLGHYADIVLYTYRSGETESFGMYLLRNSEQ